MSMLEKIREDRIKKVKKFKEIGINPYPAKSGRTNNAKEITESYAEFEGKDVTVSGRLMSWRSFGKIVFADLKDASGKIQLVLKKENIKDQFNLLDLFDVGDFVDASGSVMKTESGEISVAVRELKILAKSIRPLPEKWEGLKDDDARFRQRYLDFLMNQESKEAIDVRAKLLRYWRKFLWDKGFIEIENPSLELNPAGAEARPFITHMNAYDMDVYLRICAELWQKLSTIGGYEKVFEIARVYRNEGVDAEHNPEFTMLEFYWAYATIEDNIELHQELFAGMAKEIHGDTKFEFNGKVVDLTPPIPTKTYNDLFKEYAGIDLEEFDDLEELSNVARVKGVEIEENQGWYSTVDKIFKQKVRNEIHEPVFITEYPSYMTPLAKRVEGKERYSEMSQMVLHGMEMCRIYGELNDPIDQRERFETQQAERAEGDEETWSADFDYVDAMEYGMPPQTGSGIGFDRWVKILTDSETLREVIAYPMMKPEEDSGPAQVRSVKLSQDFDRVFDQHGINFSNLVVSEVKESKYLNMTEEFKNEYPNAVAGYAVIEGVNVKESDSELNSLKTSIVKMLRGITKSEIDVSKNLKSYRDMYKKMGVDWRSRRPSPEALLRRVAHGKEIYNVNTMVDAYNLSVMTQQVSSGAFNLDEMKTPVNLDISDGGESIEVIGGEEKSIEKGEVCYYDKVGAYNLDYNYRDADRTKITTETKNIVINVEGVGEITHEEVLKALKLNIALIQKYCGGELKEAGIVRASNEKSDVGGSGKLTLTEPQPQDKSRKMVLVLNKELSGWQLTNTVGHLTAYLGSKIGEEKLLSRAKFETKDEEIPADSQYPVITLTANPGQMYNLLQKVEEEDLVYLPYVREMIDYENDEELAEALKKKDKKDLEYLGIGIFGNNEKIDKLTKKFSMYK